MPHVVVKMYAGRSDAQKRALAEAVTQAVMRTNGCGADAVSVGIEDVAPCDWAGAVYEPDIVGKAATIFKQPGYDPR